MTSPGVYALMPEVFVLQIKLATQASFKKFV